MHLHQNIFIDSLSFLAPLSPSILKDQAVLSGPLKFHLCCKTLWDVNMPYLFAMHWFLETINLFPKERQRSQVMIDEHLVGRRATDVGSA